MLFLSSFQFFVPQMISVRIYGRSLSLPNPSKIAEPLPTPPTNKTQHTTQLPQHKHTHTLTKLYKFTQHGYTPIHTLFFSSQSQLIHTLSLSLWPWKWLWVPPKQTLSTVYSQTGSHTLTLSGNGFGLLPSEQAL
jgi:hypothetical protein